MTTQKLGFFLRVDPAKTLQNLNNGNFRSLDIEKLKKIKIDFNGKISVINDIGKDKMSDIFLINDLSISRVYATDNCAFFNYKDVKVCDWCRDRDFKSFPIGIPIRHGTDILPDSSNSCPTGAALTFFHCIGSTCCTECSLALLNDEMNRYNKMFTHDSYVLLHRAHKLLTGKTDLRPSPPWRLAEWNGGSLDRFTFFSNSHFYEKTAGVVFLPVKQMYEKIRYT